MSDSNKTPIIDPNAHIRIDRIVIKGQERSKLSLFQRCFQDTNLPIKVNNNSTNIYGPSDDSENSLSLESSSSTSSLLKKFEQRKKDDFANPIITKNKKKGSEDWQKSTVNLGTALTTMGDVGKGPKPARDSVGDLKISSTADSNPAHQPPNQPSGQPYGSSTNPSVTVSDAYLALHQVTQQLLQMDLFEVVDSHLELVEYHQEKNEYDVSYFTCSFDCDVKGT